MLYFPTADPSTWALNPKKLLKFTPFTTLWMTHSSNPDAPALSHIQSMLTSLWQQNTSNSETAAPGPSQNPVVSQ